MKTFARIVDGFAIDIQIADSLADLATRFNPEWLARNPFTQVPDGTEHGAFDNGDGTFTNPTPPVPEAPKPNNPGNPYFGKKPLATKDFWALIGQKLTPARFKRLTTDSHFLWIDKVIDKVNIVDVDDKAGQFLQMIAYMTQTIGDDAKVLMDPAELNAIMSAWV